MGKGLNVAEARRRAAEEPPEPAHARRGAASTAAQDVSPGEDVNLKAIEDRLRSALGLKVTIRNGQQGRGEVTVGFSNADELETIIDRIVG